MPNSVPDAVFWVLMIFLAVCAAAVTALVGAIWAMLRDKFADISNRFDNVFVVLGNQGHETSDLKARVRAIEGLCRERHGVGGRRKTNGDNLLPEEE